MDPWAQLRPRRWLLLIAGAVLLLATGAGCQTLPLRDSDKAEAARVLVAWIVEGRPVPGFGQNYPDARWMQATKQFFVICDFVPAGVPLSADPRVQRITADEQKAVFEKHGFTDTDYITINVTPESDRVLVLEFSNVFGPLAGHGYRFEFRRTVWGLRASGEFQWVS